MREREEIQHACDILTASFATDMYSDAPLSSGSPLAQSLVTLRWVLGEDDGYFEGWLTRLEALRRRPMRKEVRDSNAARITARTA